MPEAMIKFGTDGWRGEIANDYTFANVRKALHHICMPKDRQIKGLSSATTHQDKVPAILQDGLKIAGLK